MTDKQDFFLPGRVQVCALTLRHTQLLFTAYIQPHSCREDKSCPKFNSTLKGTAPSQIAGPKPEKCPGELLISQRKHLLQRVLLTEVIKKISANACSVESPGKQTLDSCNHIRNKTELLHWTYLKLEGMTIMAVLTQVAITRAVQIPGTWVRRRATNLRSSTRTESSPLFKEKRKQRQQRHAARKLKRLGRTEMVADVFPLSWHTSG